MDRILFFRQKYDSMKKYFLVAFYLVVSSASFAQVPASFYLFENDQYASTVFDHDNIYFQANNKLIKTDYLGNIMWSKACSDRLIAVDDNALYFFKFIWNSYSGIFKTDSLGNTIWSRDITASVCPLYNGNFNGIAGVVVNKNRIFITSTQFNLTTGTDGFSAMLTLDTSGNYISSWCDPNSIMWTNGYISHGYSCLNSGAFFLYEHIGIGYEENIVKMKSDGSVDTASQSVYLDMGNTVQTQNIISLPDSSYLAVCNTSPDGIWPVSDWHIGLSRFREDGTILWQKLIYSTVFPDTGYAVNAVTCDNSGNIYLIGEFFGDSWPAAKITIKLDSTGTILMAKKWVDPLMSYNIRPTDMNYRNGYIFCSVTLHSGTQYYPGIMVFDSLLNSCSVVDSAFALYSSTDPLAFSNSWSLYPVINYTLISDSNTISASVNPVSNDLCLILKKDENMTNEISIFPNPFQNKILIQINDQTKSLLTIFNLTGGKIFENEITNDLEIDLSDIPSGVYQLTITSESMRVNKKIIKY